MNKSAKALPMASAGEYMNLAWLLAGGWPLVNMNAKAWPKVNIAADNRLLVCGHQSPAFRFKWEPKS
jgi:hypothetical protein